MATFAQLTARVVNKYKGSSGTTFTTQAKAAINDAIEFYRSQHFWFAEGTAEVTLTAGEPELTDLASFPADFWYLHPQGGMAIVQSSQRYPVRKATVREYDYWNTETEGRPYIYRELGGGVQVYYYPDQEYTLEFRYVKKYNELSGDSDSNDFTVYAPQLIEARALSMLFLSEGHDGTDMRDFWEKEEAKQFKSLRLTNYQRVATGNLEMDNYC